jgi:hypothetical protein
VGHPAGLHSLPPLPMAQRAKRSVSFQLVESGAYPM